MRAILRYRAEHRIEFMHATDYLRLFDENGWLNKSAMSFT